jgi:Flp pilus assembly pilin Flp
LALLSRRVCNSSGQDLIEYAILAAFISVVAVAGASLMGTSINDWFASVAAVAEKGKQSNCSATGIAASGGTCQ